MKKKLTAHALLALYFHEDRLLDEMSNIIESGENGIVPFGVGTIPGKCWVSK